MCYKQNNFKVTVSKLVLGQKIMNEGGGAILSGLE